jgi:hypothetical protein
MGGLICIDFTVQVCMCIPLQENVSGLFAPAGFAAPKQQTRPWSFDLSGESKDSLFCNKIVCKRS